VADRESKATEHPPPSCRQPAPERDTKDILHPSFLPPQLRALINTPDIQSSKREAV